MRHQGRITDWRDDKGFGFVTPNGGGSRVFIHIKSFGRRKRRPVGDELVTYELTADARGRPQGANVAFVGERLPTPRADAPGPGGVALCFAATFLAFVAGSTVSGKLHFLILIAYLTASCGAYLVYFLDKVAALKGMRRTPESRLHLVSLIGGWPGAMLAQRNLRHKTQKRSFQTTYWTTVVLNVGGLILWQTPAGRWAVRAVAALA
jgi:uncharacterized membrane protein YsdA (DUF1294 family)/cold shock CspA family protein